MSDGPTKPDSPLARGRGHLQKQPLPTPPSAPVRDPAPEAVIPKDSVPPPPTRPELPPDVRREPWPNLPEPPPGYSIWAVQSSDHVREYIEAQRVHLSAHGGLVFMTDPDVIQVAFPAGHWRWLKLVKTTPALKLEKPEA